MNVVLVSRDQLNKAVWLPLQLLAHDQGLLPGEPPRGPPGARGDPAGQRRLSSAAGRKSLGPAGGDLRERRDGDRQSARQGPRGGRQYRRRQHPNAPDLRDAVQPEKPQPRQQLRQTCQVLLEDGPARGPGLDDEDGEAAMLRCKPSPGAGVGPRGRRRAQRRKRRRGDGPHPPDDPRHSQIQEDVQGRRPGQAVVRGPVLFHLSAGGDCPGLRKGAVHCAVWARPSTRIQRRRLL
eukprot:scaffold492443_cov41-Prasinocladus_malaysianus.AAC.1